MGLFEPQLGMQVVRDASVLLEKILFAITVAEIITNSILGPFEVPYSVSIQGSWNHNIGDHVW